MIVRLILWALLAAPAVWWLYGYRTETMSYGEVIHATGDLSVQMLIVTMAVSLVRLLAPRAPWMMWLVKRRRDLGVATFCYAALHLIIYVLRKAQVALIIEEGVQIELLTGWIAFVVFAALAATSNDWSVRVLRRTWKRLHRLVYLAAALSLAHWVLTAFDPLIAYIHVAILAAVEIARLALQTRARAS